MRLRMRMYVRPSGALANDTRCLKCGAQVTEELASKCWQCGQSFSFDDWNTATKAAEKVLTRAKP